MTLSGFGFNRELSNVISLADTKDEEAIALFVSAWKYIQGWLDGQQLPDHLSTMVTKVISFAPWLKERNAKQPEDTLIISAQAGTSSLWEQVLNMIQTPVTRAIVLGAFFDNHLQFIKRLLQDLSPEECIVGIDPETVQAPDSLRTQEGVRVLKIDQNFGKIEKQKAGYLHAKCLVFQTKDGNTYLASGSANPSSAAWLKSGLSGNMEMMLVRRGQEAEAAARELGLFRIPEMPEVQSDDWNTMKKHWQEVNALEESEVSQKLGIALVVDEGIRIMIELPESPSQYHYKVMNQELQLLEMPNLDQGDGRLLLLSNKYKEQARFVFCEFDGTHRVSLLVFHPQKIQETSRSDTQRQFREALGSLSSGTPHPESLLKYVGKIIFTTIKEDYSFTETQRGNLFQKAPLQPQETVDSHSMQTDRPRYLQKYQEWKAKHAQIKTHFS